MDEAQILDLVKSRLTIFHTARDTYLQAIIKGVLRELTDEKGLVLNAADYNHLLFVVDYVTWRYQSRDSNDGMPRHLQFRLHNMMIHAGSDSSVQ
jgi:hypothetical protein